MNIRELINASYDGMTENVELVKRSYKAADFVKDAIAMANFENGGYIICREYDFKFVASETAILSILYKHVDLPIKFEIEKVKIEEMGLYVGVYIGSTMPERFSMTKKGVIYVRYRGVTHKVSSAIHVHNLIERMVDAKVHSFFIRYGKLKKLTSDDTRKNDEIFDAELGIKFTGDHETDQRLIRNNKEQHREELLDQFVSIFNIHTVCQRDGFFEIDEDDFANMLSQLTVKTRG